MYIVKSFVDCSVCPLYNESSCLYETNSIDLAKVEIVFVAENPGKEEVKRGIPLIGAAGQVFRRPFDKYFKPFFSYLITNTVLCQTLTSEGRTGNPSWYIVERCRQNCFQIIRACDPYLILAMGSTAMRAFDIARQGIYSYKGKVHKWEDRDVFLTVHPSHILYASTNRLEFEYHFKTAREILVSNILDARYKKRKSVEKIVNREFVNVNFAFK